MVGVSADVVAHVPAALALGVWQRRAAQLLVGVIDEHGLRADEHEAQVVAE